MNCLHRVATAVVVGVVAVLLLVSAGSVSRVGAIAPIGSTSSTTSTTSPTTPGPLLCGEPSGDGQITPTDALYVLRAAVGSATCPLCVCDVDDSGTIAASDALRVLRYAIGLPVTMACPACTPATCGDGIVNQVSEQCDVPDDDGCPGLCLSDCTCACDADGDGAMAQPCGGNDCNDNNPSQYPGATETCNGLDDDCDGQVDEGFTRDDNPVCSNGQFNLGSVSGDTGSDVLSDSWYNEEFRRFTITEDNNQIVYLSATIQLDSPPGTDFDLYVYCLSCGGTLAGSSTNGGLSGHSDTVTVRRDDTWGVADDFKVIVEVRHVDSTVCAYWNLTITGNAVTDTITCP